VRAASAQTVDKRRKLGIHEVTSRHGQFDTTEALLHKLAQTDAPGHRQQTGKSGECEATPKVKPIFARGPDRRSTNGEIGMVQKATPAWFKRRHLWVAHGGVCIFRARRRSFLNLLTKLALRLSTLSEFLRVV
jgi:hypothetical protein